MTSLLLPAGIFVASMAMMYFFCIRPMRQGRCANRAVPSQADTELDLALRQARADLEKIQSAAPQ